VTAHILIAEDNAVERTVLRDILRAFPGCDCVETEDGQAAWQRLREGLRPELCIIDLQMPRLNGLQLLENIRRDPSMAALKVVVASSLRDRGTIVNLARLRISGYLLKPYDSAKTLALVGQLLGAAPAPVAEPPSATVPARTAFLVDDQPIDRAALTEIIKSEPGWTVVEADGGEEAWERLRGGLRPHLAIFDLRMPQLDGRALLARIREDPALRDLRVVIISSAQDREEIVALARLQISGYLLKPFDATKVKAALRSAAEASEKTGAGA
jgi:chemosensory pili system protein ChpA (sensor histidine kinase/response regulator)